MSMSAWYLSDPTPEAVREDHRESQVAGLCLGKDIDLANQVRFADATNL
jgi:hypothetical protein